MNKKRVDQLIPAAYQVLSGVGMANKEMNQIDSGYFGQISAFGASMVTGSVLATVAFFSDKKGAEVDRTKILRGVEKLLTDSLGKTIQTGGLFNYVQGEISNGNEKKVKEELIDCLVALKLAMNLYTLIKRE